MGSRYGKALRYVAGGWVLLALLFAVTAPAAAASLGAVYDRLRDEGAYADAIDRIKNHGDGITDEQIKSFLADLEGRLRARKANEENFNKMFVYSLIDMAVLPQYHSKHAKVISAVSSAWNLNPRTLIAAMRKDGIEGALKLVPEVFIEAGRIIKVNILTPEAPPAAPDGKDEPDTPPPKESSPPPESTAAKPVVVSNGGKSVPVAAAEAAEKPSAEPESVVREIARAAKNTASGVISRMTAAAAGGPDYAVLAGCLAVLGLFGALLLARPARRKRGY